jgi:hypothetical protein
LYFVGHDNDVLNLAKLKTDDYVIFRKLRNELRSLAATQRNWKNKLKTFSKTIDSHFATRQAVPTERPPDYYKSIAEAAFKSVSGDAHAKHKLARYADFIEEIKLSLI